MQQVAGEYFVGREGQLKQFHGSLDGLKSGKPHHFYIAGPTGSGKTSYLQKLVDIANTEGTLGVMPTLDYAVPAYDHIATIVKAVAKAIDAKAGSKNLARDWDKGADSIHFHLPRIDRILSGELQSDLTFLQEESNGIELPKVVVCIDEGQRIEAAALSALKNVLQHVDDFLLILSLRVVDEKTGVVGAGRAILDRKATDAEGDYGASRFFAKGIALGPFDTEREGKCCVTRRLADNEISFTEELISIIVDIAGSLPRRIIEFSSEIYEHVAEAGSNLATEEVLQKIFKVRHGDIFARALELRSQLSDSAQSALKVMLSSGRPVKADELSAKLYPGVPVQAASTLANALKGDLDRACQSGFCMDIDGQYRIGDPLRRYALRLALETQ
ncbi:ATP-binding protein [Streptomyces lydicus]|uniref:ATP-binding protein n=1 Tax=Streptomyces lydicus TaxID=47763 RepID=UPI002870627A|nr:ATP-binding protein [Streptomyces lydicus]